MIQIDDIVHIKSDVLTVEYKKDINYFVLSTDNHMSVEKWEALQTYEPPLPWLYEFLWPAQAFPFSIPSRQEYIYPDYLPKQDVDGIWHKMSGNKKYKLIVPKDFEETGKYMMMPINPDLPVKIFEAEKNPAHHYMAERMLSSSWSGRLFAGKVKRIFLNSYGKISYFDAVTEQEAKETVDITAVLYVGTVDLEVRIPAHLLKLYDTKNV